jgi:hypothetical protein
MNSDALILVPWRQSMLKCVTGLSPIIHKYTVRLDITHKDPSCIETTH